MAVRAESIPWEQRCSCDVYIGSHRRRPEPHRTDNNTTFHIQSTPNAERHENRKNCSEFFALFARWLCRKALHHRHHHIHEIRVLVPSHHLTITDPLCDSGYYLTKSKLAVRVPFVWFVWLLPKNEYTFGHKIWIANCLMTETKLRTHSSLDFVSQYL